MRSGRPRPCFPLALLCAALLATGCGDDSDVPAGERTPPSKPAEVSIELGSEAAQPRELIAARVRNESGREVTYGAGYALERETADGFVRVDDPDRAVIQIAYVASSGETGPPVRVQVPNGAEPGTYRLTIETSADGEEIGPARTTFEVAGG